MRTAVLAAIAFIAATIAGLVLILWDGTGQLPWFTSRGFGLVALALLTASVVMGLGISGRMSGKLLSKPLLFELHSFLSVLTVVFIVVHVGALMFDHYLAFSVADLILPFGSPYRPLPVTLGVVAAWLTVALVVSFWIRNYLGRRVWRTFHYTSFVAWLLGFVHGLTAGTDTSAPLVMLAYWLAAALIGALLTYRILDARNRSARTPRPSGALARPARPAPPPRTVIRQTARNVRPRA
jgi:predicted ferric reductase